MLLGHQLMMKFHIFFFSKFLWLLTILNTLLLLRGHYWTDHGTLWQPLGACWGWAMHICLGKLTTIGSDNGLSPGRRQAIIWTIAGILLIGPLGTNFSEILIGIQTFSFKKMHLKMSSGKWWPFCLGLSVLSQQEFAVETFSNLFSPHPSWASMWRGSARVMSVTSPMSGVSLDHCPPWEGSSKHDLHDLQRGPPRPWDWWHGPPVEGTRKRQACWNFWLAKDKTDFLVNNVLLMTKRRFADWSDAKVIIELLWRC